MSTHVDGAAPSLAPDPDGGEPHDDAASSGAGSDAGSDPGLGSEWVRAEMLRRMAENRSTRGRHARTGEVTAAASDRTGPVATDGPRQRARSRADLHPTPPSSAASRPPGSPSSPGLRSSPGPRSSSAQPSSPAQPSPAQPSPPQPLAATQPSGATRRPQSWVAEPASAADLPENYVPRHSVQTPGPAAEPAAPISGPIPIVRPAPGPLVNGEPITNVPPPDPRGGSPLGGPAFSAAGLPIRRRRGNGPGMPLQADGTATVGPWTRPGPLVPTEPTRRRLGAPPEMLGAPEPIPSWGLPVASPPYGFPRSGRPSGGGPAPADPAPADPAAPTDVAPTDPAAPTDVAPTDDVVLTDDATPTDDVALIDDVALTDNVALIDDATRTDDVALTALAAPAGAPTATASTATAPAGTAPTGTAPTGTAPTGTAPTATAPTDTAARTESDAESDAEVTDPTGAMAGVDRAPAVEAGTATGVLPSAPTDAAVAGTAVDGPAQEAGPAGTHDAPTPRTGGATSLAADPGEAAPAAPPSGAAARPDDARPDGVARTAAARPDAGRPEALTGSPGQVAPDQDPGAEVADMPTAPHPVVLASRTPSGRTVTVPGQRSAERTVTPRPLTPRQIPVVGTAPPEPGSTRVRVVLSERKGVARAVRTIKEVQEGTAVGELLRTNLIRSQLRVTLRFALLTALVLGVLPAVFAMLPAVSRFSVLGLRLPWVLLGVLMYPFLVGVAWRYTRVADRVEQNFADHVQD